MTAIETQVCIAGGGPAGMMAGLLLARAGIDVVVLEKHADFFRDFRGDTIHPSTLQVLHELGLLDEFLKLPHQKADHLTGQVGPDRIRLVDFGHLPVVAPFIVLAPQWDFLNFLALQSRIYSGYRLEMSTPAEDLIVDDGVVTGVRARGPDGPVEISATLTIGADGRHSVLRDRAGLVVRDLGAPMDVLWFHLEREPTDTDELVGRFDRGSVFIMINRNDYWQCGFVIPKGGIERVHAAGLDAFRARVAGLLPVADATARAALISSWDDVKLLTVTVDRLETWYKPGLLMIGDAAHAMSPIGGVGVNLAVQDAVAAARMLAAPLRAGRVTEADLAAVQRRRLWPTRATQTMQVAAQNNVVSAALAGEREVKAPWLLREAARSHVFRDLMGRLIGLGIRPEHIDPAV